MAFVEPAKSVKLIESDDGLVEIAMQWQGPGFSAGLRWTACDVADCRAERIPKKPTCYKHADRADKLGYRSELREGAVPLTLVGQTIDEQMWMELRKALPDGTEGRQVLAGKDTLLVGARVLCNMELRGLDVPGDLELWGTEFAHDFEVISSRINGDFDLRACEISGTLSVEDVDVESVDIFGLTVGKQVSWGSLRVARDMYIRGLRSEGMIALGTRVGGCTIMRDAQMSGSGAKGERNSKFRLAGSIFSGRVEFLDCLFPPDTDFATWPRVEDAARFTSGCTIRSCVFGSRVYGGYHRLSRISASELVIEGVKAFGTLDLSRSDVSTRVRLSDVQIPRAVAPNLSRPHPPGPAFQGADLNWGGDITIRNLRADDDVMVALADPTARVNLAEVTSNRGAIQISDVTFLLPLLSNVRAEKQVSFARCAFTRGGTLTVDSGEVKIVESDARQPLIISSSGALPVVVASLESSNVENIVLSGVDVSKVRFKSVLGLDRMRLEGVIEMRRLTRFLGTSRRVIRDEVDAHSASTEAVHPALHPARVNRSAFALVATVYRALRKGREDGKDAPGAADFYYGEMEMRRLASAPFTVDRLLLSAYRVVSGYGLRAWRALVILATLSVVGANLLSLSERATGHGQGVGGSALILLKQAVGATFGRSIMDLTAMGDVIIVGYRILAAVLIALAVLAVRSRLKR